MKRIIILVVLLCLFLTGCGNYKQRKIVKELHKKVYGSNGYKLSGKLSINNNDEIYNYDVIVNYKKDDYYKVILTNIANNHTQVILKNDDGVYVLTPSLNKSFKFQSDWPYNNSQIYLLDTIVRDIENDKNREFSFKNDKFIFNTKVKYPNNSKLVKQKIIMNKKFKFEKVIVYDKDGVENMTMIFDKINYSPSFSKNNFQIDNVIDREDKKKNVKETGSLDDVIYPLFLPSGTKLVDEESVDKGNGKRVIMNYDGEKSFLLVEETADVFKEFTIIPTVGEPFQLMDTLGVMTNNSLSWVSGGVEFYIVSDVMSRDELIDVASSITGIVSMK